MGGLPFLCVCGDDGGHARLNPVVGCCFAGYFLVAFLVFLMTGEKMSDD